MLIVRTPVDNALVDGINADGFNDNPTAVAVTTAPRLNKFLFNHVPLAAMMRSSRRGKRDS